MSTLEGGSSNSVGQYEYGEWILVTYCECGQQMKLLTTWKPENCGRRFWKCIGSQTYEGCGLMEWFDPPMCKRSQKIIPGLLKKINGYEEKISTLEMQVDMLPMPGLRAEKMKRTSSKCRALVCIMAVVAFVIMFMFAK
ncbi:unnamed protein product [Cuscuta epithymum]|uniref:GRF-type domain-containing protein n=1 Tax=Cuscuta epithymum TaxID=186058 RepID=A0AAV0C5C6_9ASTE|nr:unnamed protein product [Cuscuta epithymum]